VGAVNQPELEYARQGHAEGAFWRHDNDLFLFALLHLIGNGFYNHHRKISRVKRKVDKPEHPNTFRRFGLPTL